MILSFQDKEKPDGNVFLLLAEDEKKSSELEKHKKESWPNNFYLERETEKTISVLFRLKRNKQTMFDAQQPPLEKL